MLGIRGRVPHLELESKRFILQTDVVLVANAEDSDVPQDELACCLVLIKDTFAPESDFLAILEFSLAEHLVSDPVGDTVRDLYH